MPGIAEQCTAAELIVMANHRDHFHVEDVGWSTYLEFNDGLTDRCGRVSYDRGELEFIGYSIEHGADSRFLAFLVGLLLMEYDLPRRHGSSTTFRREVLAQGLEPENCFWIGPGVEKISGKTRIDLTVDPAPNLAIEVDVTHSSLDRMSICAALGIPEVWRWHADQLSVGVLRSHGDYEWGQPSGIFPDLPVPELGKFVIRAKEDGQREAVKASWEWLRQGRPAE